MDCEGDKRAFKFEEDHFAGAVRLGNAQNSLCRLAARSLPLGAAELAARRRGACR